MILKCDFLLSNFAFIFTLRRYNEEGSRFNQHPLLGARYVLMNLLGRGGFSEVFQAYDTVDMREVGRCSITSTSTRPTLHLPSFSSSSTRLFQHSGSEG